jgi:hypothetical protein
MDMDPYVSGFPALQPASSLDNHVHDCLKIVAPQLELRLATSLFRKTGRKLFTVYTPS